MNRTKFKMLFFLFLCISSTLGFTQELTEAEVSADNRIDAQNGNDTKYQGRVKIGFVVDLHGVVEVVGVLSTGDAYRNEWFTMSPQNSSAGSQPALAFRNLYVRKIFGTNNQFEINAGALSGESIASIGSAGMPVGGWVDGIRVKAATSIGDIKVVAGSLGDFKNPNVFSRTFKGNFLEIELSKKLFDRLTVAAAYERLGDDNEIEVEAEYDLKILGDKVIKLLGNALYSFTDKIVNYDVGLEMDLLKTIFNKFEKRVVLKVYFSSIDAKSSEASMIPLFYTYGPRATFQLSGTFVPGKVNWMARSSFGESNSYRHDIGIQVKFGYKKKH